MAIYYFMVGIPASGKSTYARRLSHKSVLVINTDRIRYENRTNSEETFKIARDLIRKGLSSGADVIFDATNTLKLHRAENISAGRDIAVKTICIWMDTPLDVCLERHAYRQANGKRPTLTFERLNQFAAQLADNPPVLEEGFDEVRRITPLMTNLKP